MREEKPNTAEIRRHPGLSLAIDLRYDRNVFHLPTLFPSDCEICKDPILSGEMIYAKKGGSASHESCIESIWEGYDEGSEQPLGMARAALWKSIRTGSYAKKWKAK